MAVHTDKLILLTDLDCFMNVNAYKLLVRHNTLIFEQYEHFKKGSYSNRYYVAGANGKLLLSIPLHHAGRERTAFRDLKICNRDFWQRDHWRTLTSAYRRSPWFEFYEEGLSVMYERKFEYLLDWNLQAFELVSEWLGVKWDISFTSRYEKDYGDSGINDARNLFLPGKPSPDTPVRYRQVFEERTGFLPGLSILDLIFCEGKQALASLRENRQ